MGSNSERERDVTLSAEGHELQVHSSSWASDFFGTRKVTSHVLGLCCKHERPNPLLALFKFV